MRCSAMWFPFKAELIKVLERIFSFFPSPSANPRALIQHNNFCSDSVFSTEAIGGFSSVAKRSCMALASNACLVVVGFPSENVTCGIIQQLPLEVLYAN